MMTSVRRLLAPVGSLRITVVLLALATFLVFAGTVAQIDRSIWTVVDEYFRCAFVWIGFGTFFPRDWEVGGGFWFPGGWLIGGLLLVNVLAAHIVRFRLRAVGRRRILGLALLVVGAALTWLIIDGAFSHDVAATEEAAFWRVLLRLGKGGGAAAVLLAACLLLFGPKRGGIILLHGGIVLLLVSEFVTGTTAVEGRMRIEQGTPMNYVEHTRMAELVFIDRSDPAGDRVSAVRMTRLRGGGLVSDPALPVDVEVLRVMPNVELRDASRAGPNVPNPATAGAGRWAIAFEIPESSGTSTQQLLDVPAVYVTLRSKEDGAALGTYLATPLLEGTAIERQTVVAGGRIHEVALRFARTYKPYRIDLVEFRHDKYVGTETAKNFSSVVRLVDEEAGVDRTVRIWMNNPLRYRGETFYQLSYEPGRNVTILQVVRNHGWMLPYLSCMFVAFGMTVQMGQRLLTFLGRRAAS